MALDPRGVWRGTFWTFVVPLAALIGGAAAGWHLRPLHRVVGGSADLAAGATGFILMGIAFALGMLRNRRLERTLACQPRLLRRLP